MNNIPVPLSVSVPKVSVIMPAYNAQKHIGEAIDSVRAQSFIDWELIVVNDGSTDDTAKIVTSYSLTDRRIQLVTQPNKKQAAARNTGLRMAKGEWIAFLDADDLWRPEKLSRQLLCSNADVTYTSGIKLFEPSGKMTPYDIHPGLVSSGEMYRMLFEWNPIPNLSVLIKRKLVEVAGLQNESIEVVGCEDWEYWIRLAKNGASFFGLNEDLFVYRVHQGGTSRNRLKMKLAQFHAKAYNLNPITDESEVVNRFVRQTSALLKFLLWDNKKEFVPEVIGISKKLGLNKYQTFKYLTGTAIPGRIILTLSRPGYVFKRVWKRINKL